MKKKYIILTVFLSLAVIILGLINIKFKPTQPDKTLKRTPKESEVKYPVPQEPNRGNELPQLAIMWEKNLFTQGRGSAEKTEGNSLKYNDLELVGICKFGEKSGAIIVNKNGPSAPSIQQLPPQQGQNAQGGNNPKQQPGQAPKALGKTEKRFYQLGQRLPNGFILKEIKQESVILARGSEEVVLKIQVGSKEGAKRVASFKPVETPHVNTAPPVKEEQPKAQESVKEQETKGREKGLPKPPPPPPIMNQADSIKQV
jgi:hypothetical protein